MNLVTDPRTIIIEDDVPGDSSDVCEQDDEERFFQAFADICSAQHHFYHSGGNRRPRQSHEQKLREAGGTRVSMLQSSKAEERWQWQRRKPKPRRWDPQIVDRLTASTTASRAKSQQKYINQKGDMENQQLVPERKRSVSPVATGAGMRLYAAGIGQKRRLDSLRRKQEERMKQAEEGLKFQPQITPLARHLKDSGYLAPHKRYGQMKEKLARSRLLQERERMDRATTGCTFRPTVSTVSERITRMRRKTEPFSDVGERLFFEGGLQLIRHQLRERILQESANNHVIGRFQITQEEARNLSSRLLKWQEDCDRNREVAKRKYIRSLSMPHTLKSRPVHHTQASIQQSHMQSSPVDEKILQNSLDHELRKMRCRALFFKFAPSPKSTSVLVQDVKRQVRELFPEDSSIAAALAADFSDTNSISQGEFVASLLRFERLHGPQPWGQPTCDNIVSAFGALPSELDALSKMSQSLCRRNLAGSATTSPSQEGGITRRNEVLSARTASHFRSSSLPAKKYEPPGRGTKVCSKSRGHPCTEESGTGVNCFSQKPMSQRWTTKQKDVAQNEGWLLERQSVMQRYQKKGELLVNKQSTPKKVPEMHNSEEQGPESPESVVVSSFTDDCNSPLGVLRPECVMAELEELVKIPTSQSVNALPARCDSHACDAKKNSTLSAGMPSRPGERRSKASSPA